MGERHGPKYTIDRIDGTRGYEPANCRWITQKEQTRNMRSNRVLAFGGKTQCLGAWAEEVGLTPSRISARLARGWTVERTLTTPASGKRAGMKLSHAAIERRRQRVKGRVRDEYGRFTSQWQAEDER
jgi:hypothetical protein